MTYSTNSRTLRNLLLLVLSLGLISCAQTPNQQGSLALSSMLNFWQQEKPQPVVEQALTATDSASEPEPVAQPVKPAEVETAAEPVKTVVKASAPEKISGQKKINTVSSDFFAGLTSMEIEKVRMEAWNTYGAHWKTIATRSRYVRQPLLETLAKAGAPEELQMIPVVESSYDPYAQSEVGATGLWQLMPLTAKDLRIKSNKYTDGRREVRASTKGAARFLLKQYKRFGNWPLAFAAYHLGPRGVQKRINRRPWQPEDGLKKLPLPKITRTYVRHILGLISLYRVGELQFPEPFPTGTIQVQTPVDLDALHEKAELPKNQLYRFNPELNLKHYYESKSATITLRVTRWRVPAVKKHIPKKPTKYMTVSLRKGESLRDIKKRYKATINELHRANSGSLVQLARNGTLRIPPALLKRAKAEKNPLVKAPVRLLADNSSLGL